MNDAGVAAVAAPPLPPPSPPALQFIWWLFLLLPFVIFYTVLFVRALPWSPTTMAKKPLSCDVCMTGWATIGWGVFLCWFGNANWPFAVLHALPSAGAAALLLALHELMLTQKNVMGPPMLPVDDVAEARYEALLAEQHKGPKRPLVPRKK